MSCFYKSLRNAGHDVMGSALIFKYEMRRYQLDILISETNMTYEHLMLDEAWQ